MSYAVMPAKEFMYVEKIETETQAEQQAARVLVSHGRKRRHKTPHYKEKALRLSQYWDQCRASRFIDRQTFVGAQLLSEAYSRFAAGHWSLA